MEYFEETFGRISFHGLSYVGDKNSSLLKKIFWFIIFLAGVLTFTFLAKDTMSEFLSTKTKIQIEETNANLGEVVFPSVVVCNNNQIRRSFAYWIIDMLKEDGEIYDDPIIKEGIKRELTKKEQDVFDLINVMFFEGPALTNESMDMNLLDKILDSTFMKSYMNEFVTLQKYKFLTEKHQDRNTTLYLYEYLTYSGNESSSLSKRMRAFVAMAGQWKIKQMIPHIEWKGTINKSEKTDQISMVMQQPTTTGICAWIAPLAHKMQDEISHSHWPQGAIAGENNGLLISLDTESYDYVEYTSGGVGFSLSVVHPLDIAIIEQSGINVQPGTITKIGVSSTLIRTTEEAVKRFTPYERKCWIESEIGFHYIPYDNWYQYSMPNCLFEAAMQEAHRTCDCIPSFIRESTNPCFGKKLKCYYNIMEKLGKFRASNMKCTLTKMHYLFFMFGQKRFCNGRVY